MKYYVYKNGNEFVTNKMSTDYLHTLYRNYPLHFNYTQLGKYIYALALAGGRGAGMGSSSLHIKVLDTILYSGDFETIPKHIPKVWDCSQNVKSLHRAVNI